jgi:DNA-binding NtrC family response regulator
MSIERALVVEDDELGRECVAESLAEIGVETRTAKNGRQAIEMLAKEDVDVILSDLRMPEVDGLALLRHAQKNAPTTPFVLMTAFGTLDFAIQAMRDGAEDILLKPFDPDQLALLLRRIESKQRLKNENQYLKREVEGGATGEIIGETQPIRAVLESVRRVAPRAAPARSWWPARSTRSPPAARRRSCASTARRSPRRCSRASSSATSAAPSPAPCSGARGASSWRTRARCCWTR